MVAVVGIAIAGMVANADRPETAVVGCLQPSLDSGKVKKVVVDRVERHYRLIVVPIDGDTAEVTLLVTHQLGPPFAFNYLVNRVNGRWSSPCACVVSPFAFRALQVMVIVLALTLVATGALRHASNRAVENDVEFDAQHQPRQQR